MRDGWPNLNFPTCGLFKYSESTVKDLSLGIKFVKPEGSNPRVSSETKNPAKAGFPVSGGEGGIRTLGTAQHRTLTFQASTFNHSATSPKICFNYICSSLQPLRGPFPIRTFVFAGRAAILGDVGHFGNGVRCVIRPALAEY